MLSRVFLNRGTTMQPCRRPATSSLLLHGAQTRFGFARYRNKAQATSLGMKDSMLSYEFVPEAMTTLEPAPQYIEKALHGRADHRKFNFDSAERMRTNVLKRRQNEQRYAQGRMYTHLKLHQIRESVKEVRAKQAD